MRCRFQVMPVGLATGCFPVLEFIRIKRSLPRFGIANPVTALTRWHFATTGHRKNEQGNRQISQNNSRHFRCFSHPPARGGGISRGIRQPDVSR